MRAADNRRRLRHEAAFYGSDEEFLSFALPFLTGGVEAHEPTFAIVDAPNATLIQSALGDAAGVSMLDARAYYVRPVRALTSYHTILAENVAAGAQRIRVIGEIPRSNIDGPWEWWARYEATVNHALGDVPLWVICPYDTRSTPTDVLADVARTHPLLATADGARHGNTRFEDPPSFLNRAAAAGADPIEDTPPLVDLAQPTPVDSRHAVAAAGAASGLGNDDIDGMAYAVSEAVTNARCHGRSPVRLRLWAAPDRMVATVTDRGRGPADPYAGLLAPEPGPSAGLGLWLINQTCDHVTLGTGDDGFTIRLVTGHPASRGLNLSRPVGPRHGS